MESRSVVIVSAVRTPFGKFDGVMREVPSIDLGIMAVKEAVGRINLDAQEVDELYYGTCMPAEFAPYLNVPARQITLLAGLSPQNISLTIDRACCSSMSAMRLGFRTIRSGEADTVIACGADNMSNTCLLMEAPGARWGHRLGDVRLLDVLFELGYRRKGFNAVAVDAGEVALEHGVSREQQDAWALRSQQRWAEACKAGKFRPGEEIMSIEVPRKKAEPLVLERDESPRDTTLEQLARLKTVYGSPTVTAGNAPGMSSGAAAIVMMSRARAEEKGVPILGEVICSVASASQARNIATIPASSIHLALNRADLKLDQMDLIEINEAFAAMPLVSSKILAEGDAGKWGRIQNKTNVNGGAIAIGHPVGASGARIAMTLMYELRRRGGGYGVAAICGGLAQGEAVIIKV